MIIDWVKVKLEQEKKNDTHWSVCSIAFLSPTSIKLSLSSYLFHFAPNSYHFTELNQFTVIIEFRRSVEPKSLDFAIFNGKLTSLHGLV